MSGIKVMCLLVAVLAVAACVIDAARVTHDDFLEAGDEVELHQQGIINLLCVFQKQRWAVHVFSIMRV